MGRALSMAMASLFWLSNACFELKQDTICRENGHIRSCNKKEQSMIDDMRTIIRLIKSYKPQTHSFIVTGNSADPRLLFFGEKHNEIIGRIETLGFINVIAKDHVVVLREGADRKVHFQGDCALDLVFQIFLQWQWERRGQPYRWDGAKILCKEESCYELLTITRDSYDLSGLNLAGLQCAYWDDIEALNASLSYGSLKTRNRSMVEAIHIHLSQFSKVLVMAGIMHLPSGDRFTTVKSKDSSSAIPTDFNEYYALVRNERKLPESSRSLWLDYGAGSTKPIYDYLVNNRVSYTELIHGKMVY